MHFPDVQDFTLGHSPVFYWYQAVVSTELKCSKTSQTRSGGITGIGYDDCDILLTAWIGYSTLITNFCKRKSKLLNVTRRCSTLRLHIKSPGGHRGKRFFETE